MLAWFAGLVGIAALGRWLAGRSRRTPTPPPAPEAADVTVDAAAAEPEADPAAELRRKLAEARAPAASTESEPLDERRARVHAEARTTIEGMADDGSDV